MPHHIRHSSVFDQAPVNFAVAGFPFINRQAIDRSYQMLISLVNAVPRKMLNSWDHFPILCQALNIASGHSQHMIRVAAVSSYIGNRISKIPVKIDHRGKSPVDADRSPFHAADLSKLICFLRVICSRDQHLPAHISAFIGNAVAAVFQIC